MEKEYEDTQRQQGVGVKTIKEKNKINSPQSRGQKSDFLKVSSTLKARTSLSSEMATTSLAGITDVSTAANAAYLPSHTVAANIVPSTTTTTISDAAAAISSKTQLKNKINVSNFFLN